MVAIDNHSSQRPEDNVMLSTATPANEEELGAKARALCIADDKESFDKTYVASPSNALDDSDLLPEEQWNVAWQDRLDLLKVSYSGENGLPEHDLRNFLIYVHGDTRKAAERIGKCLEWRRTHLPIDRGTILAPLRKRLFFFQGKDRAGRPIAYFRLQGHDRKNRVIEQYVQAVVYASESLVARMGGSNYRITLVIDRRGASLFNQDLELYKAFFNIFGVLYPMKLFRVILYPATTMTRVLWSTLRHFVHSHVQRRLVLVSDPQGFAPYIALDQLLASLGGELKEKGMEE